MIGMLPRHAISSIHPFFIYVSPIAKNDAKNGVQNADNYLVDKVHK
jgi:hypothetical protein